MAIPLVTPMRTNYTPRDVVGVVTTSQSAAQTSGYFGWHPGDEADVPRTTSAAGSTTSGQPTITHASGNFTQSDVGGTVTGTGIPANTTIKSVESATSATMSANATATSAVVAFTVTTPGATVLAKNSVTPSPQFVRS